MTLDSSLSLPQDYVCVHRVLRSKQLAHHTPSVVSSVSASTLQHEAARDGMQHGITHT